MRRSRHCAGQTLIELLVVLLILAIAAVIACNSFIGVLRRAALRSTAIGIGRLLERVQLEAAALSHQRGLRFFQTADGWSYAIYEDGDDDGVRLKDIAAGIDILVEGPYPLMDRLSIVRIGVPASPVPHPDTGKFFPSTASAVNFNQTSMCSFAPDGDGTPGSIYVITGARGEAAMIRSSGNGGRIRTLFYGLQGEGWHP
jgi:prepilin-type N-terminal cleavage/methylation domain-containing protein